MSYNQRKEIPMKHLFDGIDLNVYDTSVINLSAGTPSLELLKDCNEIFSEGTKHRLEYEAENGSYLFQYGPAIGTVHFRQNVAEFLSKGYKSEVFASDIVATAGATYGLHQILSTLVNLNGCIFIDDVTYMIALEAIGQFSNLKIVPVKLNNDGVDVVDLESKIQSNITERGDKMFWSIYYTIPTFHNPTGYLFSGEINKTLIKLARKYDILIACDDVYNLLPFDFDPPKRLFAYDTLEDEDYKGHVVSNGTFSKILSPGCRVGWMECPPRIVEAFRNSGILKSGGAISNYASGIISSIIELGLAEKQLNKCLETYKLQRDALCETLDLKLPSSCFYEKPAGGYFVWVKLPENCDGNALSAHCLKEFKVFAIPGSRFSIEKKFKNNIRLTFAFHSPEVLRDGAERLCKGIEDFLAKN